MFDTELETFKTSIDLRGYAVGQGYVWDKRESWRDSTVMRSQDGDKVIIKRDADGHYVYFRFIGDGDSGSIIDFIQRRHRLSRGAVGKELRAWSVTQAFTGKNRVGVESQFARMPEARRHPYLEYDRADSPRDVP